MTRRLYDPRPGLPRPGTLRGRAAVTPAPSLAGELPALPRFPSSPRRQHDWPLSPGECVSELNWAGLLVGVASFFLWLD